MTFLMVTLSSSTCLFSCVSSLIVASKYQPWPIVSALSNYVAPSRQIVVYCQHQEVGVAHTSIITFAYLYFLQPLVECQSNLRSNGSVINWKLSEAWYRQYQVLHFIHDIKIDD